MANPHDYTICVRRGVEDGEALYRATVQELPDLAIYEETPSAAYDAAIEVIEDLQASFAEKGKRFPEPSQILEASGRTTLRISKSLHQRIIAAALLDDISLNQWITEAVAWRLEGAQTSPLVVAPNAISINCNVSPGSLVIKATDKTLKQTTVVDRKTVEV